MNPRIEACRAGNRPLRALFVALLALCLLLQLSADASAQRRRHHRHHRSHKKSKPAPTKPAPVAASPAPAPVVNNDKGKKEKGPVKLDFSGLDLAGRLRTPQLLYFLERASAELQAASLERRSFIPEMVRSVDEESL